MSLPAVLEMGASLVGTSIPQVTGREKVLGRALYAGDLKLPGMLHLKVLRSPHCHARIARIDCEAARALPGVHLVLTGEDTPKRLSGVHAKEHRILATGKVRFVGEEVVVVAATDENIARDALDLIHVDYEGLPAVLDPAQALLSHAPQVHDGRSNVAQEYIIVHGDVDAAFGRAAEVYEATYEVHSQYPGYLEPMASAAWMDGNGRLAVWTSTQSVFLARARLAEALDMPASKIKVIQAATGGAFGAKAVEEFNSVIAAWVATRTDRPVRFVNSRLEDFQGARSSVPERIWLRMGADAEGRIIAKETKIVAECGAYAGLAGHVLQVSVMRSDNMHRHLQDVRLHGVLAYTNNPPRGAFRGFGGQQMAFAVNSHLNVLAKRLGVDPVEMHKRNAVRSGDTTVHGFQIGSSGLAQCLDNVSEAIGWARRKGQVRPSGNLRRGIGFGAGIHVSGNRSMGNWDGATIVLKVSGDGRVLLITGECDMGQGTFTMLAQICAHELGIPLSHVTVGVPDTDSAPFSLGAFASRVTVIAGNAVLRAAREIRGRLLAIAAEKLGAAESDLQVIDGQVVVRTAESALTGKKLTFGELAQMHIFRTGGAELSATATYDAPTVMADKNQFGNVAPAYSFAAQAAEVEVDTETGKVTVVQTHVSDDCGKALNPLAVHGQTCGAAVMAIGWTLYEHLKYENGRLLNGNFADYSMPTADSVPDIHSLIVESLDPNGPYGAKGASETAILPGAAAIANAVCDAIGVQLNSLPITPEKILAALKAAKNSPGRGD